MPAHMSLYVFIQSIRTVRNPYEVPEIIAIPVVAESESYLKWLGSVLTAEKNEVTLTLFS
ncbi:MAG: divalent cation tolerance protein CutA [Promethearchaeati archaeon SRVP18_Atabeyarchaeia-1]